MARKLLSLIASTALSASVAGTAFAASPVPLTEQQMDNVTAGSSNPWAGTTSLANLYKIVYGPVLAPPTPVKAAPTPVLPALTPIKTVTAPSFGSGGNGSFGGVGYQGALFALQNTLMSSGRNPLAPRNSFMSMAGAFGF